MSKESIIDYLDLARRQAEDFPTYNHKDSEQKKHALTNIRRAINNVRNM